MNTKFLSLPFVLLFISISFSCASISIPRLSPFSPFDLHRQSLVSNNTNIPDYYETHYYNQTIDHFNFKPESYNTFWQKYFINYKYWGGANSSAPIFVYLGAESSLTKRSPHSVGFIEENAPIFKALIVFIEHRFYGESDPLRSMEETMRKDARGYLSSAQALEDYAQIILHIKKIHSAQNSPVIVFGGSYGGMLATWFRLKYPHIAHGALASSAPILNFVDLVPQDGYISVITNDFKNVSKNCYETIRESWNEINRVASEPYGLLTLSWKFQTCWPLNGVDELTDFLRTMYALAAQYNRAPNYQVNEICRGIDGAPEGADILDKIVAGVRSYYPTTPCFNQPTNLNPSDQFSDGWQWPYQMCTEMVMPMGVTNDDSIFPKMPFYLSDYINNCKYQFDVKPRPHWATTYYGGQDIKLVLKRFASNIIFSNGLKDPYSSGGVLEDISDSILAFNTDEGSHCMDLSSSKEDDPKWLVDQRKREIHIIRGWITKYNQDLRDSHL